MKPERVRVGDVFRYHAVIGKDPSVPVRITEPPRQLASGEWICGAVSLWTGRTVHPSLDALSIGETSYGPL